MMKKIYEFKVFDILQDKENEIFLDKVKKENPDLYTKFLNLIGNKGLDVAKERYQDYDPEYKKQQLEELKKLTSADKKRIREEKQIEARNKVLNKYKDVIEEIEDVIFSYELQDFENKISNDKNIQEYLKSCKVRKSRENNFNLILKKSALSLERNLSYRNINIESIKYVSKMFDYNYWKDNVSKVIIITHNYNPEEKKSNFDIHFNLYDESFLSVDKNKIEEFLEERAIYAVKKLSKFNVSKKEIFDSLDRLSLLLSNEYYNKWYEDWKFKKDTEKYNL